MNNSLSISVVVLTYNSSETICATLNSIANQTIDTKNFELVISDDASTDSTQSIINDWLHENKNKFRAVVKIFHKRNLGIVSNLDNAYRKATGQWLKIIAGDDLLVPECLSIYSSFCEQTKGRVFLSYMQTFIEQNNTIIEKGILPPKYQVEVLTRKNLQLQKEYLLNSSFSATPSLFIQKSLLEDIGYLDKNYFLMEDYPLWIRITNFGETIHFVPKVTVYYRVQESVSRSRTRIVNLNFLTDIIRLEQHIADSVSALSLSFLRRRIWIVLYPRLVALFNNERHVTSRLSILIVNIFFKPKYFLLLINRILSK
ncbi:glycosyltransferase [Enterobacter ludwigii]|uniref:glycosyltransferase n=1 Tax=Enterobacter ludwigii TaxID=299767 RepID=UPI003ED8FF67